jgi:superfamily II DNA/RNA helicase
MDHFERGRILLSQVNILVIDEADRMLDMGFIPDVEKICKLLPFTRQTLFYSATMPPEIQRLTDQFLHNPVRIEVSRPATTASNIAQEVVEIPANDWAKREALRRLIREAEPTLNNAIVFCNRKRDVDVVAKSLAKHGFDAAPIHGDLDQSLRTKTLDKFRAGELKILVAADVAARGLDVPAVSHVFNFDVPIHADDYVHRIGRTGRAGRSGAAYMLASHRDGKYIEAIEKITGQKLARREMMDIEGPRGKSSPAATATAMGVAARAAATVARAAMASIMTAVHRAESSTIRSPAWTLWKPAPRRFRARHRFRNRARVPTTSARKANAISTKASGIRTSRSRTSRRSVRARKIASAAVSGNIMSRPPAARRSIRATCRLSCSDRCR